MKYNWYALKLVLICVVVFVLQIIFIDLTDIFALVSADIIIRPWIIITHIFLHGGIDHLLYNMIALGLFGSILEKIIGGKRFLTLFFVSGIIAAIGSSIFYPATIGASGAIMGVLGTLSILRPRMLVFIGGIPMPMIVAAGFWAILDLIGMFAPSNVANAAHLFGLFFGIGVGIYLRKKFKEKRPKLVDELTGEEFVRWENKWMK